MDGFRVYGFRLGCSTYVAFDGDIGYIQTISVVTDQLLELDPENKLLGRGPRVRLDGEEIRDQALLVSGLINRQIGGPAVKPYQPDGLWRVVAFKGSNTQKFVADKGDKLYRRVSTLFGNGLLLHLQWQHLMHLQRGMYGASRED